MRLAVRLDALQRRFSQIFLFTTGELYLMKAFDSFLHINTTNRKYIFTINK